MHRDSSSLTGLNGLQMQKGHKAETEYKGPGVNMIKYIIYMFKLLKE